MVELAALTIGLQRVQFDGFKGDFFDGFRALFLDLFGGGLEFTIDGYVGVLVEAGIGLHTGFGLSAAFEDAEIVVQEAEMPLETGTGGVVLQGMSSALRLFDEFAVCYAGCRPSLGEMGGIELVETAKTRNTADDDVLAVFWTLLVGIHHSAVVIDAINGLEVAYSVGVECRNLGRRDEMVDGFVQTDNCACF